MPEDAKPFDIARARSEHAIRFERDVPMIPDSDEAVLLAQIRGCELCAPVLPVHPRPVLQLGPRARILLASQAPGRIVHETGIPFNDRSGERLRGWLGVDREEFYDPRSFAIVPMGFCYPGSGKAGDLPPRPECAKQWRARVLALHGQVELVLAVGRYAVEYHTGRRGSLGAIVADWPGFAPGLLPLPHPSPRNQRWWKERPWFEAELLPYVRKRVRELLA